jgi:hypothetical protein
VAALFEGLDRVGGMEIGREADVDEVDIGFVNQIHP